MNLAPYVADLVENVFTCSKLTSHCSQRRLAVSVPPSRLTSFVRRGSVLERDGIDGIERDPFIGFQEGDEMDGGLFQAEGHASLGMLLAQLAQPFPERFRGRCQWFRTGAGQWRW